MRLRCTVQFEFDVPDDEAKRREAYPDSSDEAIIACEKDYIEEDPGYMLGFDVPWTVKVERVEPQA